MLWTPTANAPVAHTAVRVFPLPVSATDEQADNALPASLNATLPVGFDPVTLAVNDTLCPATDGLAELASVVVVPAAPPVMTCTPRALDDADSTWIVTLYVLSV